MSRSLHAWILAGATATGKTAAAQIVAAEAGCSILSADAMLVYRGMDIGTAKPSAAERGNVSYYGIDLASPSEIFSTGLWLADARRALDVAGHALTDSPASGDLIAVGGTGLYLKALTEGLEGSPADPEARARWQALYEREGLDALRDALLARAPEALTQLSDPSNPRRLIRALEHLDARGNLPDQWQKQTASSPIVVLSLPRDQLHARIKRRVETMFKQGLLDEVRTLRATYPAWSSTASQAIGYAEAGAVLDGTLKPREAVERIAARTRQLAKRQETWFRHQANAVWLTIDDNDPPERVARRVLDTWRQHGPTSVRYP